MKIDITEKGAKAYWELGSAKRPLASFGQFRDDVWSSPIAYVGFIDGNYRWKLITVHIPRNSGLATILRSAQENSFPTGNRTSAATRSTTLKQYDLNCVTTGPGQKKNSQLKLIFTLFCIRKTTFIKRIHKNCVGVNTW